VRDTDSAGNRPFTEGSMQIKSLVLLSVGSLALAVSAGQSPHRSVDYIATEANLVRIQVIVFDKKGAMAPDLTKKDFRVFEDGEEQKIQYFSHARQPVSLVLSLDNSQSMLHKIPFVREAAYSLLAPFPDAEGQKSFKDEFSLIRFTTRAELLAPFAKGEALQPRVDAFVQPTRGSTALFDSVYLAVATAQDAVNERRAIILVTDGGDNHSRYSLKETERFLEEADVPLFAVMAGPSLNFPFFSAPEEKSKTSVPAIIESLAQMAGGTDPDDFIGPAEIRGPHNLKVLTETTGGAVFTAGQLEDLQRIVETIGMAVRYSYLIGYDPPLRGSTTHSKDWDGAHKVHVQLAPPENYPGYVLFAKKRYYESAALSNPR
jgi:Ca-activated chloride channel family protein